MYISFSDSDFHGSLKKTENNAWSANREGILHTIKLHQLTGTKADRLTCDGDVIPN